MITQLEKLSILYEARLQAARNALSAPTRALAEIDQELARVDEILRELQAQRTSWEQQWQQWLTQDGVLRRGEEYNRFHVRLAALEEDTHGQRADIEGRRSEIQEHVDAARRALWKCQQRMDQLAQTLGPAKRIQRARVEAVQARALEEQILSRHGAG